ncbi:MAG: 30S ribosomal protein S8e [Candidatus Altiarchaeota archaeon]|nr:30S ribosomal protein S8e [Candidatus Altiarchaeota archaeon]
MYHGKITKARKKRKYAIGRDPAHTTIGEERKKNMRTRGKGVKTKLITTKYAYVLLDNKPTKCEIVTLTENPANKDFTRRNVITKGAILKVKTPAGEEMLAKVTSRPGQAGVIEALPIL